jgi:AbiV family abortive infection protein
MAMSSFPIPWAEALEGCKLSVENAKRLAEDARLLRDNGKLASAFSVSLSAWEELGKAVLLFRYWKAKQDISLRDWLGVICNHRRKQAAIVESMDILYASVPPKTIAQLKDNLEKNWKEWGEWFDLQRELGVYVDWVGAWRSPTRIEKTAFKFPFSSSYWIESVRALSVHVERILPDS